MKTQIAISLLVATMIAVVSQAAEDSPLLSHRLVVTPEIKKTFFNHDAIEIREVTGTSANFQVGGTYRVTGVCRQQTLKSAGLYIGNTAEAGPEAIVPVAGSSLYKPLQDGTTEFSCTFTLLRPGILHVTLYDMGKDDKRDNSYAGVYLGDVVFRH